MRAYFEELRLLFLSGPSDQRAISQVGAKYDVVFVGLSIGCGHGKLAQTVDLFGYKQFVHFIMPTSGDSPEVHQRSFAALRMTKPLAVILRCAQDLWRAIVQPPASRGLAD